MALARRHLLLLFIALLVSCAQVASPTHTPPTVASVPAHEVAPPLPRLAVVLHGFDSTAAIFESTFPGNTLIAGLKAQGWKVIVPEEPFASNPALIRADISKDGGVSYRAMWDSMFRADVAAVGPISRLMVVGISWGGLHALIAACDDPEVSAMVIHAPVVKASNLVELSGLSLPGLSVSACAPRFSHLRGQMSYGTIDTRVGVAPSAALASAIASPTMKIVAEHEPHVTTAADVAMMLAATAAVTEPLKLP